MRRDQAEAEMSDEWGKQESFGQREQQKARLERHSPQTPRVMGSLNSKRKRALGWKSGRQRHVRGPGEREQVSVTSGVGFNSAPNLEIAHLAPLTIRFIRYIAMLMRSLLQTVSLDARRRASHSLAHDGNDRCRTVMNKAASVAAMECRDPSVSVPVRTHSSGLPPLQNWPARAAARSNGDTRSFFHMHATEYSMSLSAMACAVRASSVRESSWYALRSQFP